MYCKVMCVGVLQNDLVIYWWCACCVLQDDLKRFVTVSQRYKDAVARLEAEAQAQAAKAADAEKQAAEVSGCFG
jgi:hypothetical protein